MALVLCVGVHPGMLNTRKLILETAGHVVITAQNKAQVTAACEQYSFGIALVTQSGVPGMSEEWTDLIRRHCPSTKILELHFGFDTKLPDADDWLQAPFSPAELLDRVDALIISKK